MYLLEQAIIFGDSHILFLGRNCAYFYFLPCPFKELNPGAQSFLQATRRHKLRSYSESPTKAASLYAPIVESTLLSQVSLSLFVHIAMKILLSVTCKRRCLKCSDGPGLWGHPTYPPWHIGNTAGATGGADIPCHVNFTSDSWHRNGHPRDATAAALIIAGRKINTTTLCLFAKSRQYGIVAAPLLAKSQLDCMAGN